MNAFKKKGSRNNSFLANQNLKHVICVINGADVLQPLLLLDLNL